MVVEVPVHMYMSNKYGVESMHKYKPEKLVYKMWVEKLSHNYLQI